jgi:hypothetical protein
LQNIDIFGIIFELIKLKQVLLAPCGTCAFFPSTKQGNAHIEKNLM